MKGVIFNILEEVVVESFGQDTWDDLLDETGVEGSYTSLGNYSDAELGGLVDTAARKLSMTSPQVLRWFGQRAMPKLAKRYPGFFSAHDSGRDFVLTVNSIIHPEVRKLYAGASCPFFHFRNGEDGTLVMGYRSERRMCTLAEGFIEGVGSIYCEEVSVAHRQCMHDGHDSCLIELRWAH